jgi:hypothetical protein
LHSLRLTEPLILRPLDCKPLELVKGGQITALEKLFEVNMNSVLLLVRAAALLHHVSKLAKDAETLTVKRPPPS